MSIAVIIGIASNNVEIPALLFPTMEEAIQFMEEKMLAIPYETKKKQHEDGSVFYEFGFSREWDKDYDLQNAFFKSFFTQYDGGAWYACGDCYTFHVKMVEFGIPFVLFEGRD